MVSNVPFNALEKGLVEKTGPEKIVAFDTLVTYVLKTR